MLSFVPAGAGAVAVTGPLSLWYSDALPGGPLTALARDGRPTSSNAGSAFGPPGLSNVLARAGQHPKVSATRKQYDAPLTRPKAAPWRNRRLAVQVLLTASPPANTARRMATSRDSAASATPPPTATSAAPLPAPRSAPAPGADSAPSRPWTRSHPKDGRASAALFTRRRYAPLAGRAKHREKLTALARPPKAPDSPAFHFVPLRSGRPASALARHRAQPARPRAALQCGEHPRPAHHRA